MREHHKAEWYQGIWRNPILARKTNRGMVIIHRIWQSAVSLPPLEGTQRLNGNRGNSLKIQSTPRAKDVANSALIPTKFLLSPCNTYSETHKNMVSSEMQSHSEEILIIFTRLQEGSNTPCQEDAYAF